MMENTQNKVHTAELMLLSANGADMHKDYHRDSRVTGRGRNGMYKDAPVCYLRFNPNDLKVYSKQTSRDLAVGDCESLADFRLHVTDWAQVEEVPIHVMEKQWMKCAGKSWTSELQRTRAICPRPVN